MRRRAWAASVLGPGVLAAAATALQWSGRGTLAGPPLTAPGRWEDWLAHRDPVVAAFALVRLAGLAALWYLAAVTAAGVVLRLLGAARLVAAADRLTVAPVRRMLAGISLGLAATTVAAVTGPAGLLPAAMASQSVPATPATAAPITAAPITAAPITAGPTTTVPGLGPPDTVTMHLLSPSEPAPATAAPPPAAAQSAAPTAAVTADRWTVRPGECFWTIAESVLTRAWGRPPTDGEIVPYWQRLIAANRAELAHPENPDLIFPGQIFQVPAP